MRSFEWLRPADRPTKGVEVARAGSALVRVHRPAAASAEGRPAILWIHGGGFVLGSPRQDDRLCKLFADRLGAVVAAVRYRRAPEHPFPAPLEDCHDALVWLAELADVDSSRVAIAGASAGGGLAASLALLARDRGVVAPVFQLLTYPMLDDRTVVRGDLDQSRFRVWNNKGNQFGWRSYLGIEPAAPDVPMLAAPARHDDLSGLPPAWIGVGSLDLFYDEDVAYATRLRDAGVSCELHVVPGAFHAFDGARPKAEVTKEFRASQLAALSSVLAPKAPRTEIR